MYPPFQSHRFVQALGVLLFASSCFANATGREPTPDSRGELRAGAYARNINPLQLPVWVNGGIAGRQIDRITDPLHARSLVLSDGTTQIAICVVDNCILPLELVDQAKELAKAKTGIDASHIMISATHTHSAVSVSGAHGTPVQEDYAKDLPSWIADSIAQAQSRMVPAQWGTTSVVCDKYIYCRDWLMKPGTATSSVFSGRAGDSVAMNPGYDNPNKLAPIGPVDMLIPILSIQDLQGKPISMLATFCTHYAGAPNISADYFAVVCERLGKSLRPEEPSSFVGLMSNSTSGNANCVDFSKPSEPFTHIDVGNYVSDKILSVVPSIQYSPRITLDAELQAIQLAVRMPSEAEVVTAKRYIETHFPDRLPVSLDENYARETVLISEMPSTRKLNLQAFRLDDFVITANPCESYNETGLKFRQASPFRLTMNVGLANGHAGYIPPPDSFQLGGYTTWRCRTSCLEEQAEPKMVDGLSQVMRDLYARRTANKTVTTRRTPTPPLSPQESLQWMELQPGFRIELAASEPNIVDPVSMQIDEHGRMWVVEMRDYPTADAQPKSRIVTLQDKDGDGYFESSTVFADKLMFATGVQPWQDGALVTVQGKLLMLRDTDGDGKADKTEVWLDGFAADNPQLRANHPTIALNGWLYIASGLRGGKVKSSVPFAKGEQQEVDITNCDLRLNMLTGQIEAIAGPTQFGLTFDQFGRRYGCSNRQPCFEIVSERNDLSMSPLSGLAGPLHEVSKGEAASRVYPLVNAWTTSNLHAGQFTAACGVLVTHSRQFPSSTFATALTCEPTGALVQRRSLQRVRGRSVAIPDASEREWLASYDPWFRPVDLYEGPNGDIYVVDMYRAVIEHPDWVPTELKNRPDQRLGDAHGRIYRVTRTESKTKETPSPVAPNQIDFVAWMKHTDGWNRSIATRLAMEKVHRGKDDQLEVARGLESIIAAESQQVPLGSIAQACLLATTCDISDPAQIYPPLLLSSDTTLRSVGWTALRQSLNSNSKANERNVADAIAHNDQLRQKLQKDHFEFHEEWLPAAWYVAATRDSQPKVNDPFSQRMIHASWNELRTQGDDPHLWMAIAAAYQDISPNWAIYIDMVTDQDSFSPEGLSVSTQALRRLAQKGASNSSPALVTVDAFRIIKTIQSKATSSPRRNMCMAILEGYANAGKLEISTNNLLENVVRELATYDSDMNIQCSALAVLKASSSAASKTLALTLLDSAEPRLAKQAIETCAVHNTDRFTKWLLDHFPSALPETRQSIFATIRNDPNRLKAMVERLESGAMTIKQFDAAQIQSLRSVQQEDIAPRLAKILSDSINSNRQKVIDDYMEQMSKVAVQENANNGRAIFEKNCVACHRLNSVGTQVGPDISDSREQSFEKLLIAILDPNRSIDANYFRYMARTHDGTVVEGVLKDANATTISLQNQNGTKTIERAEIEELKSSSTSLMPEGIEAQISAKEMAELLWYIKNWRYAPSGVPASANLSK
jgi:putative membrane-bound dehydrogenase-like protein